MEKVALVTGASRGIGKACALRLAECGYDIVVNYNSNEAKAQEVVSAIEALGQKAVAIKANTADLKEVQNMFREAHKAFGRLDVLVNNAGVSARESLYEYDPAAFAKTMDLNVNAMFYASWAAAPIMKAQGGGVILNTSSMVSEYGQPRGVAYPTSKFAVNGMTRSLARELASRGVTVNAVAPGFIATDMTAVLPEAVQAEMTKGIPLGRVGQPDDVANAVAFLAAEQSGYLTGQVLCVDGGMAM